MTALPPPIPAPRDDASAALAKEPPTPEEITAFEEAFVEQVRDGIPRATPADRAARRTPAELAKHDRRMSGTGATTLEEAWEDGYAAGWWDAFGGDGNDESVNPYKGA